MPIPGLRRPDQVEAAVAASTWELSLEERDDLDQLARAAAAEGAKMPANPFQSA
jgi:aryl-alcohol dehydrogenase-like predicted oxidoreductase